MNNTEHPVILPTALSVGTMLWSVVFGLYFLAALALYFAWCRLSEAETRLSEPTLMHVETPHFHSTLSKDAKRYSVEGNRLILHLDEKDELPFLTLCSYRDPSVSYRAIDRNPALIALCVESLLKDIDFVGTRGDLQQPVVIGTDFAHIKPGVVAARAYFDLGGSEGVYYCCAIGDTSYVVLGVWRDDSRYVTERLRLRLMRFFDLLEFYAPPDSFDRPHVNSAELTAADHERIVAEAGRERMLWRMFADRVATEPETALVSAIEHFRKQLELLSSVHEEREVLETEDFRRYNELVAKRAGVVREWFVLLDKHLATGDNDAARKQADFIVRHAKLLEESLDRRRAAAVSAKLAALEAAKAEGR